MLRVGKTFFFFFFYIKLKLEEMKPEGEGRTVKNFRRLLKKHIIAQEAGDLQTKLF